jgi:hypothetical protein
MARASDDSPIPSGTALTRARSSSTEETAMSIVKRRSQRDEFVYLVRLRDPDGKVYNRTFRTKTEAKRWELDQRSQLARGGWVGVRTRR